MKKTLALAILFVFSFAVLAPALANVMPQEPQKVEKKAVDKSDLKASDLKTDVKAEKAEGCSKAKEGCDKKAEDKCCDKKVEGKSVEKKVSPDKKKDAVKK